jgi:hypothetical protein
MGRIVLHIKLKILGIMYKALSRLMNYIPVPMSETGFLMSMTLDDFLAIILKTYDKNIAFIINDCLVDYVYKECPKFIKNTDAGCSNIIRYSQSHLLLINDFLVRIKPCDIDHHITCIVTNRKTNAEEVRYFRRNENVKN